VAILREEMAKAEAAYHAGLADPWTTVETT